MRRFLEHTWKATAAFVLLSTVITAAGLGNAALVAAPVAMLTPFIWWLMVARRERPEPRHGAIAGAMAAIAGQVVPLVLALLWFRTARLSSGNTWLRDLDDRMMGVQIVSVLGAAALGSVIGSRLVRGQLARASSH